MKVAIVDLGTNTCRLFLAAVGKHGEVEPATRLTTVVRLGQGVGETGRLHPDAIARTRACVASYAPRLEAYGPARRLLVATSVLRDAADGRALLERLERDHALPWRVLAGEEEGTLAFRGGTSWLAAEAAGAPVAEPTGTPATGPADDPAARASGAAAGDPAAIDPLLLVDIGGGSTEFAVGSAGRPPDVVRSLDIGVVRLTERFFHADPPPQAEIAALAGYVAASITAAVPEETRRAVRAAVGVAGTYTTLVAHKLGLREYDSRLVHGHLLSCAEIDAAIDLFAGLTNAERGRLPGIQPGREDVILAGALIARQACSAFGLEAAVVSEADLLEGCALALVDGSLGPG